MLIMPFLTSCIAVRLLVAATGLPSPQPDHAIRMARFANDCMNSLRELIVWDLTDRLGPDTVDLAMRFGIHRYV